MNNQVTRISAYGLLLQSQRILLCRISGQVLRDSGRWTLPGGGLNFGEDPVEAMVREVYEETGLIVRALGIAGIDSFFQKDENHDFHGIRIVYFVEVVGGALTNEVDGSTDLCAWCSIEEARELPLVELAEIGLDLARVAEKR